MDHSHPILINGRFLTRTLTGVDRFALEVVQALIGLNSRLGSHGRVIRILVPPITETQLSHYQTMFGSGADVVVLPGAGGHLWEQLVLPRNVGNDWLLSLANVGPVSVSRQLVVIHDAQIRLYPRSYSFAFRLWYRALLPILARRARLVFTVSEFSRSALQSFGIVPVGKAKIVPEGVDHLDKVGSDPETLTQFGLEPDRFILALGSLAVHKNLLLLVAAARERTGAAFPLVVAGGINSRVFQAVDVADDSQVRFIGRVSDAQLKALYQNAAALAFPSLTEGFGLPPVEAMYCGCPVIATTGGAVPESSGEAALYVDPHDQLGWTQALERLEADKSLRSAMSIRGREHVKRLQWSSAAQCLLRAIAREDKDTRMIEMLASFNTEVPG